MYLLHVFRMSALEKTSAEAEDAEEKIEADENAQTIRPTRSPQGPGIVPLPLAAPGPGRSPPMEDYSDFVFLEDDNKLQEKVADFKVHISSII